jgi:aquaporin Z
MGLTAVVIIYSPWGKRSGAHINPAVTLSFLRLGKVHRLDAAFYILAQFAGGTLGVLLVWGLLGSAFAEPPVSFVNTVPGPAGTAAAFATKAAMACALMLMVLGTLATGRLMPLVGVFAGTLVALYISFLAPLSGMSINPARSFASAAPGGIWQFLWIYLSAPVLGMLAAVEIFRLVRIGSGLPIRRRRICAKLNHDWAYRCIHCGYEPPNPARTDP